MPLPQVPSVLAPVRVGATDTVVFVGALDVVVVEEETAGPPGPVRYQFETGSPRHSPTVTARYPEANREVRM